ncbi:MAG: cystathionine beta-synthase [Myxococcales bacterium]|nr:cystathionine beta-synthase [Myxococcales bacterium]MDP3505050.1 cystathionine beta-synthase [Myxococcales bacterium]
MPTTLSPPSTPVELIGNTPMLKVTRLDTGPCELFLKLEANNPGGSIKDRIGLSMIRAAEEAGFVGPTQKKLVEATAGNTGLGLALVAAVKGYELTLVIPDKMSQEKIAHLRAMGANVVMTRSDVGKGHPQYYQDVAQRLAKETGAFYVNQFENPANVKAHEEGTGPEIAKQLGNDLDAMVVGVGSGGTLTGLANAFKKSMPKCEMVLADPKGSVLADYIATGVMGQAGSWVVEGIGEDFIPKICDLSSVKKAYTITDAESLDTARELLRKEGILAGSSSGTLIAAALKYCREQTTKKRVCTFVCDSGNKYLSKMFNDYWMIDQGFIKRETKGDLRDVISRRFADNAVVTAAPDDTLLTALARMKLYDISQLPVMKDGRLAGIVDESDLLFATVDDEKKLTLPVSEVMVPRLRLKTVQVNTPVRELMPMLDSGLVAIVLDGDTFAGLITRMDVLNYLRRRLRA